MKYFNFVRYIGLTILITQMIFSSSALAETCEEIKKKQCTTIYCLMEKNRCGMSGGGSIGPGGGTMFNKKELELNESEQNY